MTRHANPARHRGAAALALLMLAAIVPMQAEATPPPSCCFTKGIEGMLRTIRRTRAIRR
jgi:hypothetical protein